MIWRSAGSQRKGRKMIKRLMLYIGAIFILGFGIVLNTKAVLSAIFIGKLIGVFGRRLGVYMNGVVERSRK